MYLLLLAPAISLSEYGSGEGYVSHIPALTLAFLSQPQSGQNNPPPAAPVSTGQGRVRAAMGQEALMVLLSTTVVEF